MASRGAGRSLRRFGGFLGRHRLAFVVVVLVAALVPGIVWYGAAINPGGPKGDPVVVSVPDGVGVGTVIADLAKKRVITSTLAFRIYLTLHGTPVIQPGDELFTRGESFGKIVQTLSDGPDVYPLEVPPGFTVAEVAQSVGDIPGHEQSHFLSLVTSGAVRSPFEPSGVDNLDGLLAPGTYLVVPRESDKELLTQMINRFDGEAASLGLDQAAAENGVTPYQAITIAAVVQKEGVYLVNDGKVARVIYNRLAKGMRLQMDSTVLYALGQDGGPVGDAESYVSPYNTYLNAGLPPTPTCFPSTEALQAALHPTPGDWLFFVVVDQNGTEAFSDSDAGQLANEKLAASRGLG
jgi:UPF0755 protein